MNNDTILFNEFKLNNLITLKNKIVMAPMTRAKAEDNFIPTPAMKEYYSRRADAGLIITEGTAIKEDAIGHHNIPGIFNKAQIHGWKQVTDAVHQNGGLIFMQLWHVGRVSHPYFLNGNLPLSASETEMSGRVTRIADLTYGKSRAATLNEITEIIQAYATAAVNAVAAGFDGIEIHGANGYLIDQFLHYHTNRRDDEYGGTPEKMARFALEVINACGAVIGYERVAIRLSPGAYLNEIVGDQRDGLVFKYLLEQLNHIPIAYVHTGSFDDSQKFTELDNLTMSEFIRLHYKKTLIACGGYKFADAQQKIANKDFDLIAIGRPFIANPDLIHQLQNNHALHSYDASMLSSLD